MAKTIKVWSGTEWVDVGVQAALTSDTEDLATKTYVDTEVSSLASTSDLTYALQSDVGSADGIATLDSTGNVPISELGNIVDGVLADHTADTTSVHGIADTSLLATTGDVTNHSAATTSVHGIADTSLLATQSYVDTAVSGVSGGTLSIEQVDATGTYTEQYNGITTLQFDQDSGFDVTEPSTGVAKVAMNSTFKFWEVDGVQQLTATGLDTVNFIAGEGIDISANGASTPQSITITSTSTASTSTASQVEIVAGNGINVAEAAGSGIFPAIALYSGIPVISSTDGLTWTDHPSQVYDGYVYQYDNAAYGNGRFVYLNNASGAGVISSNSSTDAITWETGTLIPSNAGNSAMAYGAKVFAVLYQENNISKAATSTDGVTWTERTAPPTLVSQYYLEYGNKIFLGIGDAYPSIYSQISTDGITWTEHAGPPTTAAKLVFGNGVFALGGYDYVYTTTDGITWTQGADLGYLYDFTYAKNKFYAFTYDNNSGYLQLNESTDGLTWTATVVLPMTSAKLYYANGTYFVNGYNTNTQSIYNASSTDGLTWSEFTVANTNFYEMEYIVTATTEPSSYTISLAQDAVAVDYTSVFEGGYGGGSASTPSAGYDMLAGKQYFVDTSVTVIYLNFPDAPSLGDKVYVYDAANNAGVYQIEVMERGNEEFVNGVLGGSASINTNGGYAKFVYTGANYGWMTIYNK